MHVLCCSNEYPHDTTNLRIHADSAELKFPQTTPQTSEFMQTQPNFKFPQTNEMEWTLCTYIHTMYVDVCSYVYMY